MAAAAAHAVGVETNQGYREPPFDQVGEDDIVINAERFVAPLEL